MDGGSAMRVNVESRLSPDECRDRLLGAFGGRLRFRWSTVSRGADYDRVLGRVDGDRVTATLIHATISRISLGKFGRQLLLARIERGSSGSKITGTIRYPYLDRVINSAILGVGCIVVTGD